MAKSHFVDHIVGGFVDASGCKYLGTSLEPEHLRERTACAGTAPKLREGGCAS